MVGKIFSFVVFFFALFFAAQSVSALQLNTIGPYFDVSNADYHHNFDPLACNALVNSSYPGLNVGPADPIMNFSDKMQELQNIIDSSNFRKQTKDFDVITKVLQPFISATAPIFGNASNESIVAPFDQNLTLEEQYYTASSDKFPMACGQFSSYFMQLLNYFGFNETYIINFHSSDSIVINPGSPTAVNADHTALVVQIWHKGEKMWFLPDPLYNSYLSDGQGNPVDYFDVYEDLVGLKGVKYPFHNYKYTQNEYPFGLEKNLGELEDLEMEMNVSASFFPSPPADYSYFPWAYGYARVEACVNSNPMLTPFFDSYECWEAQYHNYTFENAWKCSYDPNIVIRPSVHSFYDEVEDLNNEFWNHFLGDFASNQNYLLTGDRSNDAMFILTSYVDFWMIHPDPVEEKQIRSFEMRLAEIDSLYGNSGNQVFSLLGN